jgi:DNA-binding transcriptional ArsR family regulator
MAATTTRELEQVYIRDVATFKAFSDPLRLQILIELRTGAHTVKEVAANLEVKATRLYYHFKILERAGLIRVVDRRMVSGIEESRYEAVGESWQPAPEAIPSMVKEGIVKAMLAMVRAELELALLASGEEPPGEPNSPVPVLTLTELAMTESEVEEVQGRLASLMEEFISDRPKKPGQRLYRALFASYKPPSELRVRPAERAAKAKKDEPARKATKRKRDSRAS